MISMWNYGDYCQLTGKPLAPGKPGKPGFPAMPVNPSSPSCPGTPWSPGYPVDSFRHQHIHNYICSQHVLLVLIYNKTDTLYLSVWQHLFLLFDLLGQTNHHFQEIPVRQGIRD